MNKYKKVICITISLILMFSLNNVILLQTVSAENKDLIEEKVSCSASLMEDFAEDRIIVVLNNEESLKFKEYSPEDFSEIKCREVTALTPSIDKYYKESIDKSSFSYKTDEQNRKYNQIICIELYEKGKEKVLDAIKSLEKREDLIYVGPDYSISICSTIPNDTYYSFQDPLEIIQLPNVWDYTTGSQSVTVGIIDTGIDGNHPDLSSKIDVNLCYDFTSGYAISETPTDPNGHGTHVAGIVGAIGNNNTGVSGVCWNIKLASLKVFDSYGNGYSSNLANAIDFAESNGIEILNFSARWYSDNPNYNFVVYSTIENYTGLFVCGAGNENRDNDDYLVYPTNYRLPNLISVGASTDTDVKWSSSNYGETTVDIFAPGEGILSCYPLQKCNNSSHDSQHYSNGYHYNTGTSMATPFVTGVAALLLSANPNLSPGQLKNAIMNGVDVVIDSYGDNVFGDICVSGGRLNAYKALQNVVHIHNYTHHYISNNSSHYSYCSCGLYVEESHDLVQSGNLYYCSKCDFETELWK